MVKLRRVVKLRNQKALNVAWFSLPSLDLLNYITWPERETGDG